MSDMNAEQFDAITKALEAEISKLNHQVTLQNNFWNRLVLGLATGIGTAIGASIIATVLILILGPLFKALGIDITI